MALDKNKNEPKETNAGGGSSGEKIKALDLAVSAIEKQFGKGSIMRIGSAADLNKNTHAISTAEFSH